MLKNNLKNKQKSLLDSAAMLTERFTLDAPYLVSQLREKNNYWHISFQVISISNNNDIEKSLTVRGKL